MSRTTRRQHTIAPLLEVTVHRAASEEPVVARLDLLQARELIGRLSLIDSGDSGVAAAMKGGGPSHLLLGVQSFYRLILERGGCVALADVDGCLWTIPARAVNAVAVRLTAGVDRRVVASDPVSLSSAYAPSAPAEA